jgi:hypothetical protein
LENSAALKLWGEIGEFSWAYKDGLLIKVPLTTEEIPGLMRSVGNMPDIRIHLSCAGNAAYISVPSGGGIKSLNEVLTELKLRGVILRGGSRQWLGEKNKTEISKAIKETLDPPFRFPGLEN